jgi:hypothetical protein
MKLTGKHGTCQKSRSTSPPMTASASVSGQGRSGGGAKKRGRRADECSTGLCWRDSEEVSGATSGAGAGGGGCGECVCRRERSSGHQLRREAERAEALQQPHDEVASLSAKSCPRHFSRQSAQQKKSTKVKKNERHVGRGSGGVCR